MKISKLTGSYVFMAFLVLVTCTRNPLHTDGTSEQGNARVAGIVIQSDGTTPGAQVTVYLASADFLPGMADSVSGYIDSITTGADGSFTFDSLDSGLYVITAFDTAGQGVRITDIHVDADTIDLAPAVLQPTGSISGVLDLIEPTDQVTIKVYGLTRTFLPNPDGTFLLDNLPAGAYELLFETPDLAVELAGPNAVTISSGTDTPMGPLLIPASRSFLAFGKVYGIYVDSGTLYVRVGTRLEIYDITNVSSPALLGQYDDSRNSGTVLVKNGYAFLSEFGTLDVRNPGDIKLVDNIHAGEYYECIEGDWLYGTRYGGLRKRSITYLWDSSATQESLIQYLFTSVFSRDIAIKDQIAYVVTSMGVFAIDTRTNDSGSFTLLDTTLAIGPSLYCETSSHRIQAGVSQVEIRDNYLFTYIDYFCSLERELAVFDLSTNPIQPEMISSIPMSSKTSVDGYLASHLALSTSRLFVVQNINVTHNVFHPDRVLSVNIEDPHSISNGPAYLINSDKGIPYILEAWNRFLFIGSNKGLLIVQVEK